MIVDSDGHLVENEQMFADYLEARYQGLRPRTVPMKSGEPFWVVDDRVIPTAQGWGMGTPKGFLNETLRKRGAQDFALDNIPGRLEDLDKEGIEIQVLYPTMMLGACFIKDRELASALCRAYNNYLADRCKQAPERLKGVAVVALQDPEEAARELRRCLTELDMVAVVLPGTVGNKTLDYPEFYPLWEEANRLEAAVGIHVVTGAYPTVGQELFDTFFGTHVVAMPLGQLVATTALINGGILDLYPNVRLAFLEIGAGWYPYWVDRLQHHHKRALNEGLYGGIIGRREPSVRRSPHELLVESKRCMVTCEADEEMLPQVIQLVGDDCIMYASDYPHGDSEWPETVQELKERNDLSEATKRKLLGDNALRFYGLKVPAGV